ncbi:phosphatidylinositol 3-kinase [Cryptosporidium canis]|nr:phosphatidylinositol 3-kinase [Cryptosporidium canis]
MYIDNVSLSIEKIKGKYLHINKNYFPIALRIHCEQYLINSSGKVIPTSKTLVKSHLVIIEESMNKANKNMRIDLRDNLSVCGDINFLPFCNYSKIYIFKLLDDNYSGIGGLVLGYSILPLISVFVDNTSSIDLPIIINNSGILKDKVKYDLFAQIYEILFPPDNKCCIRDDNTKLSDTLLGYLHITLNLKGTINSTLHSKPILLRIEKLFGINSMINAISDYIDNSDFKQLEWMPDFIALNNNKKVSIDSLLSYSPKENKLNGYLTSKENSELEGAIHRLYLIYFTGSDNSSSYENEVGLIWNYRLHLIKFKAGIPMLLHFINLNEKCIMAEVDNLINFLIMSIKEPMNTCSTGILNIEDSLNLLSREYKEFVNIRRLAIEYLEHSTKEDLFLVLPQLVQSLRYENGTQLIMFLKRKALCDMELCIEIFWLLISEITVQDYPEVFERTIFEIINGLTDHRNYANIKGVTKEFGCCKYHYYLEIVDLIICQIQFRATLLWIHRISIDDCKRERTEKKIQKFQSILSDFESGKIPQSSTRAPSYSNGIDKITIKLISSLRMLLDSGRDCLCPCNKKINLLSFKFICNHELESQNEISSEIGGIELPLLNITNLSDILLLPIDVNKALIGIVPSECFIMKSSQCPIILSCRMAIINKNRGSSLNIQSEEACLSESIYPVVESKYMYKVGDDLRQDRLVIQLLILLQKLLSEWDANDSVVTYKVTPFSQSDGLIEFLDDFSSIGSIRKKYGKNCILNYWASAYNSSINNIPPHVLTTFITSCAAYSVITFILGVGDRHLDNLLVGKSGHFIHVDFGYIFGEDPKPFPPPMKICSEMIEAMGGLNSCCFKLFVDKCCDYFRYIRRKSWLISNILFLMADSGIKDLGSRPEINSTIILERIKEKFRLDKSERDAEKYLREIIMTSSNALFPAVVDTLHDWALYWA